MTRASLLAGFVFVACRTAGPDLPALVTSPTPESRAEIARTVSGALNGAPVTLAEDALTREDTLAIERAHPRSIEGAPSTGRETERPERFRLVKSDGRCVLVHEATGRRYPLSATSCTTR
jgi:hypothetical protein